VRTADSGRIRAEMRGLRQHIPLQVSSSPLMLQNETKIDSSAVNLTPKRTRLMETINSTKRKFALVYWFLRPLNFKAGEFSSRKYLLIDFGFSFCRCVGTLEVLAQDFSDYHCSQCIALVGPTICECL